MTLPRWVSEHDTKMFPHEHGGWVDWKDVAPLLALIAELSIDGFVDKLQLDLADARAERDRMKEDLLKKQVFENPLHLLAIEYGDLNMDQIAELVQALKQENKRLEGELARLKEENAYLQTYKEAYADLIPDSDGQSNPPDILKRPPDSAYQALAYEREEQNCELSAKVYRLESELATLNKAYVHHMQKTDAELVNGKQYLTNLLKSLWPAAEPLNTVMGLASQIDNWIVGLRRELAEAIASHQKQNARVDEFENVFCDEHLDNLPKRCPACELAEARKALWAISDK